MYARGYVSFSNDTIFMSIFVATSVCYFGDFPSHSNQSFQRATGNSDSSEPPLPAGPCKFLLVPIHIYLCS